MQISNYYSQNYNSVNFKGLASFDNALIKDRGKISKKTAKLMSAFNDSIEKDWKNFKKDKLNNKPPKYTCEDGDNTVILQPIYSQKRPTLLIECINGRTKENILLDRVNPNNFRYEKVIDTDHGSATLKSYDSRTTYNKDIDSKVDNLLQRVLEKLTTTQALREYFEAKDFIRKSNGIFLA